MNNTADFTLLITPNPNGEEPALSTWSSFVAANADLRAPDELAAMRADLLNGKPVILDEGAAGTFTLTLHNAAA